MQSPKPASDTYTTEAGPSERLTLAVTAVSVAEITATDNDETHDTESESPEASSAQPAGMGAAQDGEESGDGARREDEETTEDANQKESEFLRALRAIFTTSNLLVSSIGFASAVTCYRYIKWAAPNDFRDDCRATAASEQNITEACSKALRGSMPPPPFRLSSTELACGDFDEELFRKLLLSKTDNLFPRLWQHLLFEVGYAPKGNLLFFATTLLPAHFLAWYFFVRSISLDFTITPSLAIQIPVWVFSYQAIGLTGSWLIVSKSIIFGLRCISKGRPKWSKPFAIILAACLSYDAAKFVVACCCFLFWITTTQRTLGSKVAKETAPVYGTFGADITNDERSRRSLLHHKDRMPAN